MLTQSQIEGLKQLIDLYYITFVTFNFGSSELSEEDKETLRRNNVEFPSNTEGKIDEAYRFGILSTLLREAELKKLSYKDLTKKLKSDSIKLNPIEKETVRSIKQQTLSDIKGLSYRIKGDVERATRQSVSKDRKAWERLIRREGLNEFQRSRSVKEFSTGISDASQNWGRDFDRVADYVFHTAFDQGRASGYERESGREAKVFKSVFPGACRHCISLYLTNGIGSEPIIFPLSQLHGNGTNIGRKSSDWKPVIGPTHPFCRCTLNRLEEGYVWDESKSMYVLDKDFKRKVKRKS